MFDEPYSAYALDLRRLHSKKGSSQQVQRTRQLAGMHSHMVRRYQSSVTVYALKWILCVTEHDISTTREILWWLSKGYGFGSVTNGLFLLLIIVRAPGSSEFIGICVQVLTEFSQTVEWSHLVYLELFEDQRIGVYVLISPRNMAI